MVTGWAIVDRTDDVNSTSSVMVAGGYISRAACDVPGTELSRDAWSRFSVPAAAAETVVDVLTGVSGTLVTGLAAWFGAVVTTLLVWPLAVFMVVVSPAIRWSMDWLRLERRLSLPGMIRGFGKCCKYNLCRLGNDAVNGRLNPCFVRKACTSVRVFHKSAFITEYPLN